MAESETAPEGFAEWVGTEWLDFDPDNARARLEVTQNHLQPYGMVHGGVYATLAESICSAATYEAVREDGMICMGQANNVSFLRPIFSGHVNATARARQRGRTTWTWDVDLTDDEGNVCALVRMVVAVRPRRN